MIDNRLHRARVERDLELSELSARTSLGLAILQKIDQGRFSELPAGLYARAYVRSFAAAVGLDPEPVVMELTPLLPEAPDPFPIIRQIKQEAKPTRPAGSAPSRCAAAAVDAAMLLAVGTLAIRLIAYVCGVTVTSLVQHEAAAVALVCAVPAVLYFVLFGGIGGRTPGAALFGLPESPGPEPLGLNDILLRTIRYGAA